MEISLKIANIEDKELILGMFSYYLYDMSRYTGWDIDAFGKIPFDNSIIDPYFKHEDHYPYFITVDNNIAGFILLRKYPYNKTVLDVGQFFVLGKYKGKGIGFKALKLGWELYPGSWQVRVLEANSGAKEFWLKAISRLNPGNLEITRELYENRVSMDFIRFN